MIIVWDELKRIANIEQHGMDFAELDVAFFEQAIIRPSHSKRWLAIGLSELGAIAVVFRPMGREALSVISMRPANRRERKLLDG
jgi:uncharacterized DUF497 family protein